MRRDEEETRRMVDHNRGKAQKEQDYLEYVHIQGEE